MRLLLSCALLLATAVPTLAQATFDQVRDELRQSFRETGYASYLATFIHLGVRDELGAASEIRLDDGLRSRYAMIRFGAPSELVAFEGGHRLGLEWELGQLSYTAGQDDIFEGSAPSIATSWRQELTSWSGRLGLWYRHELGEGFYVRPSLAGAGGYIESKARYGGPGAPTVGPLLDGLIFNWDSRFVGASAEIGFGFERSWTSAQAEDGWRFHARTSYQRAWLHSFDATDELQEFDEQVQSVVTTFEQRGPFGIAVWNAPLYWQLFLHNAWFPGSTGDQLGFSWFNEWGAGIELDIESWGLPLGALSFSGSYFQGSDLDGFSIGFGVSLSL